jgi:hypothetical protein
MPDVNPSQLVVYAAIAALIAWRLYSRVRRLVGRQTMNPSRAWTSVVAFSALLALLASSSIAQPLSAAALAAGAGLGAALGLYGLRVTRFEGLLHHVRHRLAQVAPPCGLPFRAENRHARPGGWLHAKGVVFARGRAPAGMGRFTR